MHGKLRELKRACRIILIPAWKLNPRDPKLSGINAAKNLTPFPRRGRTGCFPAGP